MFLGSNFSMVPSVILPEETGCQKTKMAAAETGSTYNSASRLDRNAISTATSMFSGYSNPNLMIRILSDTRGTGQSKMAAAETGSTYNSAFTIDRNAISKTTHFGGSLLIVLAEKLLKLKHHQVLFAALMVFALFCEELSYKKGFLSL